MLNPLQSIQESEEVLSADFVREFMSYFQDAPILDETRIEAGSTGVTQKMINHQTDVRAIYKAESVLRFFKSHLRTSFISLLRSQITELKGRMKYDKHKKDCGRGLIGCTCDYHSRFCHNAALSQTISLYENLITDLQK